MMRRILSYLLVVAFMLSTFGTGTVYAEDIILIETAEDLLAIHDNLSASYKLVADIDMKDISFEPIGNESEGAFTGTIDGNGYKIKNLLVEDCKYTGFIGYLEGTVKNLELENLEANGYNYVGGIAAYSDGGDIVDCVVSGSIDVNYIISATIYAGGISGYSKKTNISNCNTFGSLNVFSKQSVQVGGISGYLSDSGINYAKNNCSITVETDNSSISCGGVVANSINSRICNSKNLANLNCNQIYNSSVKVSHYDYIGGIAGISNNEIIDCINYGKVYFNPSDRMRQDTFVGGIAGAGGNLIKNSVNTGEILSGSSAYTKVGGIVGCNNNRLLIDSCHNSGTISSLYSGSNQGGMIGRTEYRLDFFNCYNSGFVGNLYYSGSGGFIGSLDCSSMKKCVNSGAVFGTEPQIITGYYGGSGVVPDNFINLGIQVRPNKSIGYNVQTYYSTTKVNNLITKSKKEYNKNLLETSYSDFTMNTDWQIDEHINSGFPTLRNLPAHLELNEGYKICVVGEEFDLIPYFDRAVVDDVTYESIDADIAKVSEEGTVTAVAPGMTMISAVNSEGYRANCTVYVYKPATDVSLSDSEVALNKGETYKIASQYEPDEITEGLVWQSSNTGVATVSTDGTVTAVAGGEATISLTAESSLVSAECKVKVISPVTNITLSSSTLAMKSGETSKLTATITPSVHSDTLVWTSSNEDVATVENGTVTAKLPGNAVITVTSSSGVSRTCAVTVTAPALSIAFNKTELELENGFSEILEPIINPTYSTDTLTWTSSNTKVAKVSATGLVTTVATGTTTITVKTSSGASASCFVTVVSPKIPVTSVDITDSEIILTKAATKQIATNVLPSNATNKTLTWTSSNDSVVSVSNTGIITAVSDGVAIIRAESNNGYYDECVVKVISASGASVILSDAKASPDGIVRVKASLVKNPGISGYKFTVNYDETLLTPVAVTPNSEFGGSIATNLDDDNRVGLNIAWYSNEDVTVDGELFTIDFKVSDTAEYGDSSSVSIECGAKDICNTAGKYFAFYIDDATVTVGASIPGDIYEDGEVTIYDLTLLSRYITSLELFTERQKEAADVNNDELVNILDVIKMAQYLTGWSGVQLMSLNLYSTEESAAPVISVGSASVNATNEAEIPVYIKGNIGIAAYRFVLDYNSEDIEILNITPSDLVGKDAFNTNLGAESQSTDGLIVTSHTSGGNVTDDGVLFTVKIRYKNPVAASVSPISIVDNFDNMGNEYGNYVAAIYETGYALGSDYIVANKVVGDTNFSCELYFDDSYAEQTAKAIIAFYDGDGRMVQLQPSDITVKPGKVDLSIDYDKKAYASYKLMIWEGMNSMKPITAVK